MPLLLKDQPGGKALLAKQGKTATPARRAGPCTSCGDSTNPAAAAAAAKKPNPAELFPCIHFGEKTGTTPCEKRRCAARIAVYSCALLQECTLSENVPSKPYCGNCDRREPPPLTQGS